MSFLAPWSALIAAAVAIPLLIVLYVLKLRRQRLRVASTLLWKKSTRDLEVNAPFQRLRWWILLLLQLLLLLALLAALGEPILQGGSMPGARLILIIDRSASMSATDAKLDGKSTTRLAAAQDAARRLAERVGRSGGPRQIMVLVFGATAQVVSGFDSRSSVLIEAIDSIEPTDEEANLNEALRLAEGFATPEENESRQLPDVAIITDGGVGEPSDPAGFLVRAASVRLLRVGPEPGAPVRNIGMTAIGARRDYDDPTQIQIFARFVNASSQAQRTNVTLRVDDQPLQTQMVTLPATAADGPMGEASLTFSLELPGGAVVTASQSAVDSLAADDAASIVVPARLMPRVLLVHPPEGPDSFLLELLRGIELRELQQMTAAMYDSADQARIDSGELAELIVFDRVTSASLPGISSLSIGAAPPGVGVVPPSQPGGRRILSWDRMHPIMRHVALDDLVFADFGALQLPERATALSHGPDGPVIALLTQRGVRHVVVGFALGKSNWVTSVSLVVFLQNVIDQLTPAGAAHSGVVFRAGEPITVRPAAAPGVGELRIEGPISAAVPVRDAGPVTLPALRRAGLYRVVGAAEPMNLLAIGVLSDGESDLRPRGQLTINAEAAAAGAASSAAPRELWPWLLLLAVVLLVVEWLVYSLRTWR